MWTFGAAITAYLAIIGYYLWIEDSMIFFPDWEGRELRHSPADVGLQYSDVEFFTEDGTKIHGWFVPHAKPRVVLIYCHGNAGNIGLRLAPILRWHTLGASILIFDYPGFGQSEGQPSEQGTYASARAAWNYLTETQKIPANRVVLFGRSLGGGVAAQLATEVEARGLIMASSFTSVPDVAAEIYWWLPLQSLMTVRYESLQKIGSIHYPVLVMHSPDDEVVPYAHGKRLYENANDPKQFFQMKGGHNNGPAQSEPGYSQALDRFVTDVLEAGIESGENAKL